MINYVIAAGRLTDAPQIQATTTGMSVAKFSLAVSRKLKNGEEETSFFRISAFGKTAEACHKYIFKGSRVIVMGSLRQERWKTRDGQSRETVGIIAEEVHFLDMKSKEEGQRTQKQPKAMTPMVDDSDVETMQDIPF